MAAPLHGLCTENEPALRLCLLFRFKYLVPITVTSGDSGLSSLPVTDQWLVKSG